MSRPAKGSRQGILHDLNKHTYEGGKIERYRQEGGRGGGVVNYLDHQTSERDGGGREKKIRSKGIVSV